MNKSLYMARPNDGSIGKNYTVKVGPPNPKTLANPIMPAPLADFEHWRGSKKWLQPSMINSDPFPVDVQNLDTFISNPCEKVAPLPCKLEASKNIIEPFAPKDEPVDGLEEFNATVLEPSCNLNTCKGYSFPANPNAVIPAQNPPAKKCGGLMKSFYFDGDENLNGVDDEYYYDASNVGINLPTNLTTQKEFDSDSDYNRKLFTQNIQPNIFSRSQVIEPINANIGISFNPQFQPLDIFVGPVDGEKTYTRLDPQLVRDKEHPARIMENPVRTRWTDKMSQWEAPSPYVNTEDIYDPRFYGYGDAERSYVDMNLGQVRYYYSDINAYKTPNFAIRSLVDHMDFHDSMGAIKPEYRRNVLQEHIRDLTNDQFTRDALSFREDLMERQMRRRNSESWQLRAAPIRQQGSNSRYLV